MRARCAVAPGPALLCPAPARGRRHGTRNRYELCVTDLLLSPATVHTRRVHDHDFDLLVIGSGPGAQRAAIAAAKLDRRVAVVERPEMLGGVCVNTGTIPSKTLRQAILYLTGVDQREIYGQAYRVKDEITIPDLTARTGHAD